MILSHDKRFIFIHIYKSAGTSVREELKQYDSLVLQSYRWFRFLSDRFPALFPNKYPRHITASQLKAELAPEVFEQYFKFAFVRNPWDWHVSQYHYILGKPTHHQHRLFKDKGFDGYVDYLMNTEQTTQKSMLCDANGTLLVDFVGKLECINEDFAEVCERIGIPYHRLPHSNKSERKGYQEYYTERTRNLIAKAYAEDVEFFDYHF